MANTKRGKVIKRFKNRVSSLAIVDQKEQDIFLIDLILKRLYNDGDKKSASLEEDVFKPNKIRFTDAGRDRLWDVLLSTGLVKPEIGFGKSGSMTLTNDGYQLMSKFGSYKNFIDMRNQQAQAAAQAQMMQQMPQFIFSAKPGGQSAEEEEEEQNQSGAAKLSPLHKPGKNDIAAQNNQ